MLHGDSAALETFVEKFGLDDEAARFLQDLGEAVLETVIAQFDPRGDTRDVTGKLYAFAKSVAANWQQAEVGSELDQFAATWHLDSAEVSWLHALPPNVSRVLIDEFDPKEDTRNVMGKLRGFARSIQSRQETSRVGRQPHARAEDARHQSFDASRDTRPQAAAAVPTRTIRDIRQRISGFAAYWSIEESAKELLLSLPSDVQETVMAEFDPKGDTKNVSGKLLGFARSVAATRQGEESHDRFAEVLSTFATYWGLDAGTTDFLHSLPEETQAVVIREFDPREGTRDINGKLRMFAKGIAAYAPVGSGRQSAEVPLGEEFWNGTSSPSRARAEAPQRKKEARRWEIDDVLGRFPSQEISDFAARWELDDSAVTLLESLPEDVCASVMEQFDPRADTHNVSGKLAAFASTILNGKGSRSRARANDSREWNTSRAWNAASVPAARSAKDDEEEFLATWGLAEHEQARNVLKRLPGDLRAKVMQDFAPAENTKDVVGKFIGFANSVANGGVKKASSARVDNGSPFEVLPPWASSPGWQRHQIAKAASPADRFADQWQLDEGARALLRGLDPDVQASVISKFDPTTGNGAPIRDMSGKFCSFARSVAARGAPSRGQKRSWDGVDYAEPRSSRPRH